MGMVSQEVETYRARTRWLSRVVLPSVAAGAFMVLGQTANASVIYDSMTGNAQSFSEGYQCCQIVELGDRIQFAGTDRNLGIVSVQMDQYPITAPYTVPLTLNLYNDGGTQAGSQFATRTVNVNIGASSAQNHFAVNFDFSGVSVPDTIFYGLTFPTTRSGGAAGSLNQSDSLNFVVRNLFYPAGTIDGPVTVGTDLGTTGTTDIVYSRHNVGDPMVDDSLNDATKGFSNGLDQGFTPAIRFNATPSKAQAVPEPSTIALFAVGLLGLGFVGYRRKKRTTV